MAPNVHLVIKYNNIILAPPKNIWWPPSVFPLNPNEKIFGSHHFFFYLKEKNLMKKTFGGHYVWVFSNPKKNEKTCNGHQMFCIQPK
jgi:hypothetical protein